MDPTIFKSSSMAKKDYPITKNNYETNFFSEVATFTKKNFEEKNFFSEVVINFSN